MLGPRPEGHTRVGGRHLRAGQALPVDVRYVARTSVSVALGLATITKVSRPSGILAGGLGAVAPSARIQFVDAVPARTPLALCEPAWPAPRNPWCARRRCRPASSCPVRPPTPAPRRRRSTRSLGRAAPLADWWPASRRPGQHRKQRIGLPQQRDGDLQRLGTRIADLDLLRERRVVGPFGQEPRRAPLPEDWVDTQQEQEQC